MPIFFLETKPDNTFEHTMGTHIVDQPFRNSVICTIYESGQSILMVGAF